LLRLAQVHAAFKSGRIDLMDRYIAVIGQDPELPQRLSDIGRAWQLMLAACRGASIQAASRYLIHLAQRQADASQHYFSAISFHNAAQYEVARGEYLLALQLAEKALAQYAKLAGRHVEEFSTRALIATVCCELGYRARCDEEIHALYGTADADADAYADCAWNIAMMGDPALAMVFLDKAYASARRSPADEGMRAILQRCEAAIALTDGRTASVAGVTDEPSGFGLEPDFLVRNCLVRSAAAVQQGSMTVVPDLLKGLDLASGQGADRTAVRLRIGLAAVHNDGRGLAIAITHAGESGQLALLEMADVIVAHLNALQAVPEAVTSSMHAWPGRWLPALRRQMSRGNVPSAHAAARLLAEHGTVTDAPRLVAFEKTYIKSGRHHGLSRALIRRASPKLVIHDLGRSTIAIGPTEADLAKARRRAASLLMFLVTRPSRTATREQVVDELWPNLEPSAAVNSLNQTLYFLRRDIDPWYDDSTSADYVVNESELIWLDPELTRIDSVAFLSQATDLLGADLSAAHGQELLSKYRGRFAPEFEYEEWAIGWRERLHATFLLVVHGTERALRERGDDARAVEMLMHALAIDPDALEVETSLVRALRRLGAEAAATEQYTHLARSYRRDLGVEPPPFSALGVSSSDLTGY
jgi:DNA-binding SARP family transcriptional activator